MGLQLSALVARLQVAYQTTTKGKFAEAQSRFREVLYDIPLLVVDSKNDLTEATQVSSTLKPASYLKFKLHFQLLAICREYLLGLAMEQERRNLGKDAGEEVR